MFILFLIPSGKLQEGDLRAVTHRHDGWDGELEGNPDLGDGIWRHYEAQLVSGCREVDQA